MLISKTFHNFCSVCAIQVTILQFPSIFSLTSLASTKRNFFNPLAGARMRNPFFGKVRLKDFYLQFYFPFCNSKGRIC